MYVGYSNDIKERFRRHKTQLRHFSHSNVHLQNAWLEYKENNFLFEILEECEEQFLCSQEHWWCNMLDTHNRNLGYNLLPTNPNGRPKKVSKETITKQIGHIVSEETKEKIRQARKLQTISMEDYQKAAITRKERAEIRGYYHSEETKNKIGIAHKGAKRPPITEESRKNLSNAMKGKCPSEDCLKKAQKAIQKPILQYNLNGDFIQEWPNAREPHKKHGFNFNLISMTCRGLRKSHKNFIWKFK